MGPVMKSRKASQSLLHRSERHGDKRSFSDGRAYFNLFALFRTDYDVQNVSTKMSALCSAVRSPARPTSSFDQRIERQNRFSVYAF